MAGAAAAWYRANTSRHREVGRTYYTANRERVGEYHAAWYAENADRAAQTRKSWKRGNPHKVSAYSAKRRALNINACPPWLTHEHWLEILAFYSEARRLSEATGIPHEVDHIHPLVSDVVCGLHVPWNLRVIPAFDNRSKGNRLEPT